MTKVQLQQHCESIIAKIMDDDKTDDNILFDMSIWDWSQGVALYGIWSYYAASGKMQYRDYLEKWFEGQMPKPQVKNVNTMAPLLTLCRLYEETRKPEYLNFCTDWADWVLNEMPRTEMGGIQHITIDSPNTQQLWADTVFMTVLFLIKCGQISGRQEYIQEGLKQFLLHIRYLADKASGLWYHGYSFIRRDNFAGALWARGNCWFTMAAAELPLLDNHYPWVQEMILDAYRKQAEGLRAVQAESGLWHTLLDDPEAYTEVSGSAGFVCGLLKGLRTGSLDESYRACALRGAEGVIANIGEDGMVQNVSYGTVVADNLEYYKKVRLRPTGYGQNIALMMLVELMAGGFYEE